MVSRRLRNWCFTLNNPDGILDPQFWPNIRMCVFQLEIGDLGNVHYQGYAEFTCSMRRNMVAAIPDLAHAALYERRGTRAQAVHYCIKPVEDCVCAHCVGTDDPLDPPIFFPDEATVMAAGVRGGNQGTRTDLNAGVAAVKRGISKADFAEEFSALVVKYHRGFDVLRQELNLNVQRHADAITTIWICGPPGTGKSYYVMNNFPESTTVYWKNASKWWDGLLSTHTTVVFNDFDSAWFTLGTLKRILDTGPLLVETKGGNTNLCATAFIFTSNYHPKRLYTKKLASFGWAAGNPLYRRFPLIRLFDHVYQGPLAVARVDQAADWDDGYEEVAPAVRAEYGQPQ